MNQINPNQENEFSVFSLKDHEKCKIKFSSQLEGESIYHKHKNTKGLIKAYLPKPCKQPDENSSQKDWTYYGEFMTLLLYQSHC